MVQTTALVSVALSRILQGFATVCAFFVTDFARAAGGEGQSAEHEALLIVRDDQGLAVSRFQDIRSVKISPKGRIVVVHRDGVAAVEPELVSESFLENWGLSLSDVRQAQLREEESRLKRFSVRRATPREALAWLKLPAPSLRDSPPAFWGHIPWSEQDQAALGKLRSVAEDLLVMRSFPWWDFSPGRPENDGMARTRAVVRLDARFDSAVSVEKLMTTAHEHSQDDEDWLEALPRAAEFDVWRDVWTDFPLIRPGDILQNPADYLDTMIRIRGLLGPLPPGQASDGFCIREGEADLPVRYDSLIQAASVQQGLQQRIRALRDLPRNFSKTITIVGELSLDQAGRPVLDLIDFQM